VAAGVRALLLAVHSRYPLTHIVLTALLPRADDVYNNVLVRAFASLAA
jgi:hypothetical protein